MGAFDHLEWTYDGVFEQLFGLGRGEIEKNFSKNSNARGFARGGMSKLRFEDDEEKLTVHRLREKFKWFKKEWRRIDSKIICGTGLGRVDTKEPKWFKILVSPHFCNAADQMTLVCST